MRWDIPALRAGGSVALAMAVPLSIAASVLIDRADEDGGTSSLAPWLAFFALFAFVIGAGVAAWHQEKEAPLSHGIVAAVGAFVIGQGVLAVYALLRGSDINVLRMLTNLTLTMVAGTVGGGLGAIVRRNGITSQYRRPPGGNP